MALSINDTAPDFEAQTTEGKIRFHDWIGDKWAVLFSHPKDFTPVCTTELGYMAKIKPEFDKRGVKIVGLSVDPVDKHAGWANDIEETQGYAPNYPIIGDCDLKIAKLYDMLPANATGDASIRTAADNQTVRNVFVIGPDKKLRLILVYPMTTGRNFDEVLRVIDSLQLTSKHKVATRCLAFSCSESITRRTSSKLRPVVIGYTRTILIFLSGPITNTLRTVWLSVGVRVLASPEVPAGSIPYSFATVKSESPMTG